MSQLTSLTAWEDLKAHQQGFADLQLSSLFSENPNRQDELSFQLEDLVVDFSKNLLTQETLDLLVELARERGLSEAISKLVEGEVVNQSENRAALHTALRNKNPKKEVEEQLDKIEQFTEQLKSSNYTDIIHIGVGGSDLGPRLVVNACKNKNNRFNIHFVSCLDGELTSDLMAKLNPDTTLVIVASKSFTTLDTIKNATMLSKWLPINQIVGISANVEEMKNFGILPENQFLFWDWVGGRYSIWSAVGLVIAIALGFDQFKLLLEGAEIMDQHFQNTPLSENIPVIMGLLTVWYNNFWHAHAHAVLPYSSCLALLPAYLQQLEMESCGKQVTQEGEQVDYATGQVIFGEVGFNAQHAFMQMLHQGTQFIPVDFILPNYQDVTLKTALAQSQALMIGQNDEALPAHKKYPGNRPSTVMIFPEITPKVLGMLLAMYEHKVFSQSVIWGINPFDQWGVELGKKLTKTQNLIGLNVGCADSSNLSIPSSTDEG